MLFLRRTLNFWLGVESINIQIAQWARPLASNMLGSGFRFLFNTGFDWFHTFVLRMVLALSKNSFIVFWCGPAFLSSCFHYIDFFLMKGQWDVRPGYFDYSYAVWVASVSWFLMVALVFGRSLKNRAVDVFYREVLTEPTQFAIAYYVMLAGFSWAGFTGMIYTFKKTFSILTNEGMLHPKNMNEVRKKEAQVNMWSQREEFMRPENIPESHTMTFSQVRSTISNNQVRVVISSDDPLCLSDVSTNGVFIKTNLLLINYHSFVPFMGKKNVFLTIRRGPLEIGGVVRKVGVLHSYRTPGHDFLWIKTTHGPSFLNIEKRFVMGDVTGACLASMLTREKSGELTERTLLWDTTTEARNEDPSLHLGSIHRVDRPTEAGDCGSMVVASERPFSILGIHTAVTTADTRVAFAVSRCHIEQAEKALIALAEIKQECYIYANAPQVPTEIASRKIEFDHNFHPRDNCNFIPSDLPRLPLFSVVGNMPNTRVSRRSDVSESILAPYLEKYGIPKRFGPPQFDENRNYAESFQKMINPMYTLPVDTLRWAISDYVGDLVENAAGLGYRTRPLDLKAVVNGIPGNRFIKGINMSTGSGYGLPSPKRKHFIMESVGNDVLYVPSDYLLREMELYEEQMERGEIPATMYVAALKDEPTELTKTKVRVFQVGPVAHSLIMRKYLLPILAYLYSFNLLSESGVAMNVTNKDWDELGRWLRDFSPNQCMEGDFSGYDLRQTGQTISAAGDVLVSLAIALGYSHGEARKVGLLIASIASKFVLWNGSLLEMHSMMPSGTPVTIAVNGITNSLLHRVAFYESCSTDGDRVCAFREKVRLMTMGDDSVASSREPRFNMRSMQEVMARYNMPYTDAMKSVVAVEFVPFSSIHFCKRHWRMSQDIGFYVAPIELDSIIKSISCYTRSKESAYETILQQVDGAYRELARHDRTIFDHYWSIISAACIDAGIHHKIRHSDFSYDDWQSLLKQDYADDPVSDTISELTSSGSDESSDSQAMASLNLSLFPRLRTLSSGDSERLEWL